MKTTKISQVNVEAGQTASLPIRHVMNPSAGRTTVNVLMTAIFALLLIPSAQLQSKAQALVPEYVPLTAEQLDQLVAPIALDPDPLVAQILIGATFPDQVSDANNWISTKLDLSPDQRAAGANNMSWDPSVKGLVVFPVVLDSMAKNTAWTAQLGNAYYNQPDDVENAIQAMRLAAYQTHYLVATAQQTVELSENVIEILPANPEVVLVQYYDPWAVWGTLVEAYPGFVVEPAPAGLVVTDGVAFEPAVSVGVDFHFGFSFGGWAPGWGGGAVVYNNNVYNSNSRTVADRGHFGGHDCHAFEHGGRGVPAGFHPGVHGGFGANRPFSRPAAMRASNSRPNSTNRPAYGTRFNPARSSYPTNRAASNMHSSAMNHASSPARSMASNRPAATNRFNTANSTASRNSSRIRPASYGRSTPSAQSASASRSSSPSFKQSRSAGASPSSNRLAPGANRSVAGRQSLAGPGARRAGGAGNSVAANRPASRPSFPTSGSRSGQAINRPPAANRPAGGSQAMGRPASMTRAGGGRKK